MKPARARKCKTCGEKYTPTSTTQQACSYQCAIPLARKLIEKRERREWREKKNRLKTKAAWAREAQTAFNAWIRHRDRDLPCISCNRHHTGQYHAGHYRSVGSNPGLRFEPLNCHKQCSACNNHKSGNVVEYRINLLNKIGADAMEWLEGPHDPKRYTADDLKNIRDTYRAKLKEAQHETDTGPIQANRRNPLLRTDGTSGGERLAFRSGRGGEGVAEDPDRDQGRADQTQAEIHQEANQ